MKTKKRPLSESPRYKEFIRQRDLALDTLHQKTQSQITDILGGALQRVLEIISFWYAQSQGSIYAMAQLEQQLNQPFSEIVKPLLKAIEDLRQRAYVLSQAGEVEAIGRAIGKPQHISIHAQHGWAQKQKESPAGGDMEARIRLYLDRMKHKIIDAVKLSAIQDHEVGEVLDHVRCAFPPVRYFKRPEKVLKSMREAKKDSPTQIISKTKDRPVTMSTGFIDPNMWEDVVDDYTSDYIFTNRGPDAVLDVTDKIPQYEWELEQDVTQDFVHSVRDGQLDAARDNGINDFVWIAIIDDKTDDCCIWRNGLTSSEISVALQGEHSDDECDTDVPPAHWGCRCAIAPMTDEMPERPPDNIGDFNEWLTNS